MARELPGTDTGSPKPAVPHGGSLSREEDAYPAACLHHNGSETGPPSPWQATLWAGSGVPETQPG